MNEGCRLQSLRNSISKFNSIVVKMLKPVLCSSRDDPLNFKRNLYGNIAIQHGFF
jgi:hypothetical protein